MRTLLTTLLALVFAGVVGTLAGGGASAQVYQTGTVTAGHVAQWVTNGAIKDGGAATNGSLTGVGIQSSNGCSFGINSGPITGAYTQLCIGVSPSTSSILFADTAFGGATHIPITFSVNGNPSLTITDTGALVNGIPIGGATIPNNTLLGNTSGITALATAQSAGAVSTLLGLGTAAFVNTGSSGATIPLLNVANTWGANQSFPSNSITLPTLAQIASGTVLGNVAGSAGNVTATAAPVLGVTGGPGGSVVLVGATSGNVTLRVSNAAGTNGIFQLPTTNGSGGQFLQTDGAGATSWQNVAGGGTVNAGTAGQLSYYAASTNTVSGNTLANISSGALTLGLASTTAGSLVLEGGTSGAVTLNVPLTAGSTNFTFPGGNGTSGQFLQTNGSGVTSWQDASGTGTVNAGTAGQLTYYAGSGTTVSGNANATVSSGALTLGQSGTGGSVVLNGSSTGTLTIKTPAAAGSGSVLTLPAGTTDFSGTGGTSQVVKQTSSGGALTVAQLACGDLSNSGTACTAATGTSGATVPLLNAANTWSAVQTFNNSAVKMTGSSSGATTITSANAGASNFTLTIPAVNGTAVTTGDSNTVTVAMLAQAGANTMLGNWTSGTANNAANAMPSCADSGGNHLNYVSGTGVTCGTGGSASVVNGYINGYTLSNDGGTPNTKLDIAAGYAANSTNSVMITGTAFVKSTGGAWASGTGSNGMGTGLTIVNTTWYHVFAIINNGAFDVYFDTSITAANKPTNTTAFRRIGSFLTNGSAQIVAFTQKGNNFFFASPPSDASGTPPGSATLLTLTIPLGIETYPIIEARFQDTTPGTTEGLFFWSPAQGTAATQTFVLGPQVANTYIYGNSSIILSNTASQIYWQDSSVTSPTASEITLGWIDPHLAPNW